MKVGLISFAHMHAYSYAACLKALPGVEIVGIADDQADRGQKMAQQFQTQYFSDYQDLLRETFDAVVVCTENARHAAVTVAAAEAGKHVLCEKPIATNVDDAVTMIRACRQRGVSLQIAFPCRFNVPVARAKQIVDEGRLGRIIAIRGTNRGQNPGGWFVQQDLSGGGAVLDHTVHVVDLMRWIMRSEVTEVYAEVDTRFYDIPTDDCGLLMLEFENGVFASHDPSWSRPKSFPTWGDVTMEIVGTDGVTHVDAFAQHLTVYNDNTMRVTQDYWGNDMDLGLVIDFVECVRTGRPPSITGEDGLRAMEVALAAYESARTGRPVKLQRAVV
ncbi:MAG: Gfo/Idh/MocA family oxidoreductase [Alicyclobacillus sp.]|nr:Gfo/Idh/MocA family oxidoreductase [Alicyclobacillus sp.]